MWWEREYKENDDVQLLKEMVVGKYKLHKGCVGKVTCLLNGGIDRVDFRDIERNLVRVSMRAENLALYKLQPLLSRSKAIRMSLDGKVRIPEKLKPKDRRRGFALNMTRKGVPYLA